MTRPRALRALLLTILLVAVAAPPAQAGIGPDYVSSDNLELVTRIKLSGDGVGARIVGKYMYVTSTKGLNIFDIEANPENPPLVGLETFNLEFENEEVPTNGKILGISADTFCIPLDPVGIQSSGPGCLSIYDVTNPASPTLIKVVPDSQAHTSACVLDCSYFMGSNGQVVDARDPANAKMIGDWEAGIPGGKDYFQANCHHLREVQPGIVLGSCQPIVLMSIRPEDGGDVLHPVVIATGTNEDQRFVHSSRWPQDGRDKFVIVGGETNFSPTCDDTRAAFMVWDATDTLIGKGKRSVGGFTFGTTWKLLSEVRPSNGQYIDGHSPYNALGCSVHWFTNHPTFHNGGLVALAEYENGTRLIQVTPDGKMIEQGWFLPLAGSTSAPHFHPNGKVIYAIDYERGIDVLRYTGPTYAPDNAGNLVYEPGTTPGTNKALGGGECATTAGFSKATAKPKGRGVRFDSKLREAGRFDVEVFQRSAGRSVLPNRLRVRFSARKSGFTWNGRGLRGAKLRDGYYVARFTTRTSGGKVDRRQVVLLRRNGRFRSASAFTLDRPCGAIESFSLSSPVFGGRSSKALRITYKLSALADNVTIQARVGTRLVKSFTGGTDGGKKFSYTLPASAVKRGKIVQIGINVRKGGDVTTRTLAAKRL